MKPWIEKYRPNNFNEIILDETTRKFVLNMIDDNNLHNTIFYGPPGTGKTSTIMCMMNEYTKKYKCKKNYIHLNASHDRGINVVKQDIYDFVKTKSFFNDKYKFVILDEVDSMTSSAQYNLHDLMGKYNDTYFFLICNYIHKIIEPIRTKLMLINFYDSSKNSQKYIKEILKNENKNIPDNVISHYRNIYKHDIRSVINSLQSYNNSTTIINDKKIKKIFENYSLNKLKKIFNENDNIEILNNLFIYIFDNFDINGEIINEMNYIYMNHDNSCLCEYLNSFLLTNCVFKIA